jgi:lipopolysaccharide transport system permease protein
MLYYQIEPTWNLIYLPLLIIMMITLPAGIGMWVSALAIRFRDVKFAMPFIISMLIYTAPIIYTASSIPELYRFVYSLNPIVGVIEGYRACLLGYDMPWSYIIPGLFTNLLILITGARYFKKMERIFVDVI